VKLLESLTGGLECIIILQELDASNPHIKESVFYIKERIDYYILQGWLVSITEVKGGKNYHDKKNYYFIVKFEKIVVFLFSEPDLRLFRMDGNFYSSFLTFKTPKSL
jgi:hypothetical protein